MHESLDEHMLERILQGNQDLANHNREHFDESGIFAINLMSAPGAGKTSLLEKTISSLVPKWKSSVIEGDMVGELDAARLRHLGTRVKQICTGRSCHLDASMLARELHNGHFLDADFLFIENVGNLVCPAEFPLGEHKRVVLLSVSEGDDKPLKYPIIFRNCDAVLFTKCDLLPYVNFDRTAASEHIRTLNADADIFSISVVNDEGVDEWLEWLRSKAREKRELRQPGNRSAL